MESNGADVIYATDSAGRVTTRRSLCPGSGIEECTSCPVGHHAHDNLGCAIAISLAAAKAGATYLDGSLGGMGAGAGNAGTEMLVAALKKSGYEIGADLFKTMDAAEKVLYLLLSKRESRCRSMIRILFMGYAGYIPVSCSMPEKQPSDLASMFVMC
jgi:4-hydroxy 2-oxovalerate aldolase